MSIIRFFRDVICAPYSIPIGIINYKFKTLGMCSETSKKELDIKDTTDYDVSYSGSVGHTRDDLTSASTYSVFNQAIQDILIDASNIERQTVNTDSTVTISCPEFISSEGEGDGTTGAEYTLWLKSQGENKMGNDGIMYDLQMFGCCPSIIQNTTIAVIKFDNITEDHYERIYNELELHIENTLTETGSETPSSTDMSVLSGMSIRNLLIQSIRSQIENYTNQTVNVDLIMDYTDRYGRCSYDYDENGYLMVQATSCGGECGPEIGPQKCCGRGKVLEQTVTIETLTKNIIETSMTLIMDNSNTIDSDTTVTVNRITNYRVIVVSILWNVIIIFILFKIFGMFLRRIN